MISFPKFFEKNPVVDSVVDNFRTKTTNPFFGTLIVVWIFHNWRLVYMLFNFDEGTKLSKKLEDISHYLDGWDFVWNLLLCVGIALVVVIFTYVFLGISKYFSGYYNEKVSPKIDAMFGDENIVSKDKYLKLDRELGLLRKENGEYKEEISAVEDENRELEEKILKIEEDSEVVAKGYKDKNDQFNLNLERLTKVYGELRKSYTDNLKYEPKKRFSVIMDKMIQLAKRPDISDILKSLYNGDPFKMNDLVSELASLNIVHYTVDENGNLNDCELTDLGQKVLDELIDLNVLNVD